MSLGVRPDPTNTFKAGRWVKCMAIACIVWAGAILLAVPANAPAWEHAAGFVILYAIGWVSPPVWLVAYIAERVLTGREIKHRAA